MRQKAWHLFIASLAIGCTASAQQVSLQALGARLPQPITNNAVAGAIVGRDTFLYSFGGLDSSRRYDGITRASYRYRLGSKAWDSLPPLPDTTGKLASAASNLGGLIYIIGGYHVLPNTQEKSSLRVHVFDPKSNTFLPDAAPLPHPIDDHVQCVWRDSLIYVISGWSNKGNVPYVQIFDPRRNSWQAGTPLPATNDYMSFGAAGTILHDTIYYYGGAGMARYYPGQHVLRRGAIDAKQPTHITWLPPLVLHNDWVSYRCAAVQLGNEVHFVGGASHTYNYNGMAYQGGRAVQPSGLYLRVYPPLLPYVQALAASQLPMDLRQVVQFDNQSAYIIGGMLQGPSVSDGVWLLQGLR